MAAATMKLSLVSQTLTPLQTHHTLKQNPPVQHPKTHLKFPQAIKSHKSHVTNPQTKSSQYRQNSDSSYDDGNGIPIEHVKTLVKFKSRHNYIRVLEISRKADHSLAGSRLLLLDGPGNIHSISFLLKSLTNTYFDVFATIPPIIPPGPLGILGFGAGSAAKIILEMYPQPVIHGWELDPSVISVGRRFFRLQKLENDYRDKLFIYVGNALDASVRDGFSGILVDLYSKGCVIPELQAPQTWKKLKGSLRKGGRIMVNVGGSCVEPEDSRRSGEMIMQETLKAIHLAFPGEVFVLNLGNGKDDSSIALTGALPNLDQWKKAIPKPLKFYVDMWEPYKS